MAADVKIFDAAGFDGVAPGRAQHLRKALPLRRFDRIEQEAPVPVIRGPEHGPRRILQYDPVRSLEGDAEARMDEPLPADHAIGGVFALNPAADGPGGGGPGACGPAPRRQAPPRP